MTGNRIYRRALERVIPEIPIKDGTMLITGASGLIGSCLIDLLMIANEAGRKFNVYALGRDVEKLRERFSAFANSSCLNFVEQDVRSPLDENVTYDYIIHGASNADPQSYALHPAETMLINIEGATNVLNYCKSHPTTKALMMSTFEVYGKTDRDVNEETDNGVVDITMLRSCYPESKRCVELLTHCYVDEYGVQAVIARLCSIYGPTMAKDDSKAHAQFIRSGVQGKDIVLKSKGEQRRTYCYVIDSVTGLLTILARGTSGTPYNIANENSVASIAEVAQTAAEIAGTKIVMELPNELEKKGYSKPQNCILDNTRLRKLGWHGHYNLVDGLKECMTILKEREL